MVTIHDIFCAEAQGKYSWVKPIIIAFSAISAAVIFGICYASHLAKSSTKYTIITDDPEDNKEPNCQDKLIKTRSKNGTSLVQGSQVWFDRLGFDCDLYENANWCEKTGKPGTYWSSLLWGDITEIKKHHLTAVEACCACGGGEMNKNKWDLKLGRFVPGLAYPYFISDYHFTKYDEGNSYGCIDCKEGKIWHDSMGFSCMVYHYAEFCTKKGKTGLGWNLNFGTIADYKNGGKTAFDACKACGA